MGIEEITVNEYTCDGCTAVQWVMHASEYMGYRGDVRWDHKLGGNSGNWVACSKKCITKAITNVLEVRD